MNIIQNYINMAKQGMDVDYGAFQLKYKEMLAALDCENIADRDGALLEQLSMEAIIRDDPEYIFVVLQSADPADAQTVLESTLLSNPAWSTLTAVKEGRYHVMDQTLFNLKPDARWGEAYEQLADILYPAG